MRRLIYLLLVLLAAGVTSCHRAPGKAELHLIAIDSLIATSPDSALMLLQAVDTASLPADGELRAYYALLTCQAMYKAYIPATSDTLISRAWHYYEHHNANYDRRIRTMLYMGTTAEELGNFEDAMCWYKDVERQTKSNDFNNKGMASFSMAFLYQQQYLAKQEAISKLREAYNYFQLSNNKKYALFCLTFIGANYLLLNNDSSYYYARKSLQIASEMNDTISICQSIETLMGHCYLKENWYKVKYYASNLINYNLDSQKQSALLFLSSSMIHLNEIDSAKEILNSIEMPLRTAKDSVLYYETMSLIEKHNGDIHTSYRHKTIADSIAAESVFSNKKSELLLTEQEMLIDDAKGKYKSIKKSNVFLFVLIAFLCLAIIVCSIYIYKQYDRLKQFIEREHENYGLTLKQLKLQHEVDKAELVDNSDELNKLKSDCVNQLFRNTIYSGVRGTSIFKYIFGIEKMENKSLISINIPDSFWHQLERCISMEFPNAFENLEVDNIDLSENERKLIMLDCIGIPNAVISIILGYSERSTASIRYRVLTKMKGNGKTLAEVLKERAC